MMMMMIMMMIRGGFELYAAVQCKWRGPDRGWLVSPGSDWKEQQQKR